MTRKTIQLLVTSDIHGYIMPTSYRGTVESIGLARAASKIEQLRQIHPTILMDNGDLIQGSPLAYYHQRFHPEQPNPIIEAANAMRYDLAVFGNHEFNFGLPALERAVGAAQFPWISANIYKDDGTLWMKPYLIIEKAGVRMGMVGVTTHFVARWEAPEHVAGLYFEDALVSAKRWLAHMREHEQVDVTVLCYHGGFAHDLDTGKCLDPEPEENQGYLMCKQLDFDILITGHQHREISRKAFGKSVIQPGTKGNCIGGVTIEVEMIDGKVAGVQHEPVLYEIEEVLLPDERVMQCAKQMHDWTETWLDEPIGHIAGDMQFEDAFDVRVYKHPYIEFIQRVQMHASNAPISCTALFHDGPGGFREHVTMRDIVTNYIYPNTLKVLQVSGQQLLAALEQCASYFTITDGQLSVDESFMYPKAQPYNYDMWEGIEYIMDISQPVGERVICVTFQGKPIDLDASYEVVMNHYRATGAGNFLYFLDCPVLKDIQIDMTELIANYFMEHPVVDAVSTRNWRVIY